MTLRLKPFKVRWTWRMGQIGRPGEPVLNMNLPQGFG